MNLQIFRRVIAGLTISTAFVFALACSTPAGSLSPTGPTAASSAAASQTAGTDFSINPDIPPPPDGVGCSPGYWKNHEDHFESVCQAAADLHADAFATCGDILTAITCKGSNASCGRQAAASLLNEVSGCVED